MGLNQSPPIQSRQTIRSKDVAISAGVLGMLVWYGFFIVIGEGYFHMWQTEIGLGSVEGAFRYGSVCAVLMFYIARGAW
ncbi:MAG: DUF2165 family protein [Woeseiaceae bacterium]|nr:DUF2165 family protein [Woeseiaceae bacterium]